MTLEGIKSKIKDQLTSFDETEKEYFTDFAANFFQYLLELQKKNHYEAFICLNDSLKAYAGFFKESP